MIILASKSPRRKQLLELAEISFEVVTENTSEDYPIHLPIADVPLFIARNKALAVLQKYPERIVLAADTIVVFNNEIIGKPTSIDNAMQILTKLSGNTHKVITGISFLWNDKQIEFSDTTEVTFHALSSSEIEYYVNKHQPFDKAGAYAIQEWIGAIGIQSINGCFYNVMGLPISKVRKALLQLQE